jgi:hypothetical protein
MTRFGSPRTKCLCLDHWLAMPPVKRKKAIVAGIVMMVGKWGAP